MCNMAQQRTKHQSGVQCNVNAMQCKWSASQLRGVWYHVTQWSEVQCNAVECNVADCSGMQCSGAWCNVMQCSGAWQSAVECDALQCSGCNPMDCKHDYMMQWMATWCRGWQHGAVDATWCSGLPHSAVQCSAVQCSAVQCSAVQCSAVQKNTTWHSEGNAMHCNGVQWCMMQHYGMQCNCNAISCDSDCKVKATIKQLCCKSNIGTVYIGNQMS